MRNDVTKRRTAPKNSPLLKILVVVLLIPLAFFAALYLWSFYLEQKATPPSSVIDVDSFLAWRQNWIRASKVTDGNSIYYEIEGPAGGIPSSGTAGYAFDSKGKFIGWTKDRGDFNYSGNLFPSGGTRTPIAIKEMTNQIRKL